MPNPDSRKIKAASVSVLSLHKLISAAVVVKTSISHNIKRKRGNNIKNYYRHQTLHITPLRAAEKLRTPLGVAKNRKIIIPR
ncbi:unnamed protein product [Allacma fusca]|uniref:Uncharacterized protein n=1 Tax=Allacma fusca TaxID=39272 RepID=A0A8J2KTD8_9HEXA|nr:unnamed protein product [Allacma fusca]